MLPRFPVLLWRSLLWEMVRGGTAASAALVALMAFAVTVQYLADGRIDLSGAVRLMSFALIPMLQYALPFACGFAATLTYHRLAADNEATAAMAGGISHRAILAPAGLLGLILAAGLALMAHQVIPGFLRSMEEIVRRDLTGIFARAVERGEPVRLGALEIIADEVTRAGPDRARGAVERLRLRGVLAIQLDKEGRVESYVNADQLDAWVFEEESDGQPFNTAQLVFRNATGEGRADAMRGERLYTQRIRIPSAFVDDPKFLTYEELTELRRRPENLGPIELQRLRLARALSARRALDEARAMFAAAPRPARFSRPGGETIAIVGATRPGPDGSLLIVPRDPETTNGVQVDRILADGRTIRLAAPEAKLAAENPDNAPDEEAGSLTLVVKQLRPEEGSVASAAEAPDLVIVRLRAEGAVDDAYAAMSSAELLNIASEPDASPGPVAQAASRLASKIEDLQREVTSKLHERAAHSFACFFTLICGAVTAMRRRGSLPLPVYLFSFFPALAAIITISGGQGLTHQVGAPGLILLWSGVTGLAIFTAVECTRLSRR